MDRMPRSPETVFKALSDRTRLRIIGVLLAHEACVCELQAILGLSQPLLSRHVAHLRMAGLIRDRRVANRVYCSLELEGPFGKKLRTFLRSIIPQFEPFQEDASRLKAHMERSDWTKLAIAESARPAGDGSS